MPKLISNLDDLILKTIVKVRTPSVYIESKLRPVLVLEITGGAVLVIPLLGEKLWFNIDEDVQLELGLIDTTEYYRIKSQNERERDIAEIERLKAKHNLN